LGAAAIELSALFRFAQPVVGARDRLERGDIVAGILTITPEGLAQVDFAKPFRLIDFDDAFQRVRFGSTIVRLSFCDSNQAVL